MWRPLKCTLCGTTEDADDFVSSGNQTLCRTCRTCKHGLVHYREGASDICYVCFRDWFTYTGLWGSKISSLDEYWQFAIDNELQVSLLFYCDYAEEELARDYWDRGRWWERRQRRNAPTFPLPWLGPGPRR